MKNFEEYLDSKTRYSSFEDYLESKVPRPKVSASDIDYAAAETGGGIVNLPETLESVSARKSPIVEAVAKAAMVGKARRPVHVLPVPDIIQANIGNAETMYDPAYMNDTGSSFDNVRDVAAGMAKIPTTAAKSIADVSALLTNDYVGRDASNFFGRVNEDIDNTLGSERLRQSKAAFNDVMNDPNKNIGDMAVQLMDNPRVAVDQGITQLGTMLPIAGASKGAELAAKAAKYGPEAVKMIVNAATIGTNALMNAADTFGDENMQKASTLDRYSGAAVSGLMSAMSGIVTGGGAEGQIARKLIGDVQTGKPGALNAAFRFAKSVLNEGGQEVWEEGGNVLGNYVGTDEVPDFNNASKQIGFAGALGALMGASTHPLTRAPGNPTRNTDPLAEFMAALKAAREATEQAKQETQGKPQAQPAVQEAQEAQVSQGSQRGKDETLESLDGQRPADNIPDNPLDIIIANGGIRPDVLSKDLGWTDEEIAKLPQGVVTDDGKALLPVRRALKKAGLDTDVNAILDAASRPEAPEIDFAQEEAQLMQQGNQPVVGQPVVQEEANDPENLPLDRKTAAVEFTGEELGGLDVPIKTLKVRAANYARKHFSDKIVTVASDGANIIIASGGIKKALSGNVSPVAAIVMSKLDTLIESGHHIGSLPDEKGRNTVKAVHYYETPVSIGGSKKTIRIVVRENPDGKRYYDHFEVRDGFPLRDAKRLTGEAPGTHSDQPAKGKQLDAVTSNISENATSGNRIDQKKYFTAKDSSFVAVVDTGSTKPVMTAIGKNGETKEIPVGKHVEQMVQDGRLKSISKEDADIWLKEKGLAWLTETNKTQSAGTRAEKTETEEAVSKEGIQEPQVTEQHIEDTVQEKETEKGVALYSRMTDRKPAPERQGMSVDELRLLADTLVESFHNAPGVIVADSPQDAIPDALPDGMGLFDPNNGKVFLFARNIRDADTARAVFAHEVIAHYGLRGFFGDSLGDVLVSIRNHNPKIEKFSQEWWSENQDYIKQVRENEGRNWTEEQFEKWQRDISIEEAMAFFAEQGERITGVKRLVGKIQELLRDIAKRLGWKWPTNLANWLESKTDAEALSALHQAELFVRGDISGMTTTTKSDIEKYRVSNDQSLPHNDPVVFARKNAFSGEDINRPDSAIADRIRQAMQTAEEKEKGVNTRRAIEDKYIDIKLVQRAIEESGGVIGERQDAYLHVRQYVRRTSDQLKRLQNNGVKPILTALNESGVTLSEANDWLYARHVWLDRVNERLKNLPANRDKPNNEALSGMSDADAKAVLRKHAGNEKLQELGKLVDRMTKFTRERMVNGGLVPKGMVELWEKTYSHYVPLMRDEEKGGIRKSRGFVVRGQESKQRKGSERRAANILENIFAQAESTIIRAEKAEAARALYRLAKAFPNPDLWKVMKSKTEPVINPETGLMEWKVDELYRERDNVLIVKLHGEEHLVTFNEKNPNAVEIAKAFKNLDAPQIPQAVQLAGEATRYIGRWLTTRNILFASRNFVRDVQHALFNLSDTPISGKEGQVLKNLPQAAIGYIHAMRGKESDDKYADYAREFMEAGGETGFIKSMESINDYRADLERQLTEMNQENYDPHKWWRITWEAVENANNVIENSTRLAVYVVARENGISIRRAAMLAGEITVDFNKRGQWTGWLNSLWMFSNANIQGHARMLAALKHSKKARILAAGLVGAGFVMSFAARALMGKDDETGQDVWDEISDFDKERNWIIPIPWKGGKEPFIRLPLPQGLHVLPNVGRTLEEMIFSSKKLNPIEKMLRLALLTVDAFNPFGSSGSIGQFIAPSIMKPVVQIAENKSFTGLPLHRSDTPFGGYNEPAYAKAFRNTPKHWIAVSEWLNRITGGDDVSPGHIDIAPETLRLAVTSYFMPGVSSQIVDPVFNLASKIRGKDAISVKDVPGLSSFAGIAPDERMQERAYYDRMKEWQQNVLQAKEYGKAGRIPEFRKSLEKLGDGDVDTGLKRARMFDGFQSDMRELNQERKRMENILKEHPERRLAQQRLEEVNERRERLIRMFIKAESQL